MPVILDISTAVPEFSIAKQDLLNFYRQALAASGLPEINKKLSFLLEKTKIKNRYSCIPDFEGKVKIATLIANPVIANAVLNANCLPITL